MTITHAEFFRLMPGVFEDRCVTRDQQSILASLGAGTIKIVLAPERNKNLDHWICR